MTFDAGSIEATATLDKGPFIAALNALKALGAQGIEVPLKFSTSGAGFAASVASAKAAAQGLAGSGITIPLNVAANPASAAKAAAATKGFLAGFNALQTTVTGGGGGWWGFLTGRVPLFGGLGGTIAQWHLLADAIIEVGAVLIPATIGVAAFGAVAAGVIGDIKNQMVTLNTVSTAFGINLPHLGNGLTQLQNAIKPQVYSLFGDALTIISSKSSGLRPMLMSVGAALDSLASRFTIAATNGSGFGRFMQNAGKDVLGIGTVIGNFGGAIGNIIKQVPGYAQIFLGLATGISHVAEMATAAAGKLLYWGMALHGAFIYGGLAATGLIKLGQSATTSGGLLNTWGLAAIGFGKNIGRIAGDALFFTKNMGLSAGATSLWIDTLGKIPGWGWAVAGVAALVALTVALMNTKSATGQLLAGIQADIAAQSTWIGVMAADAAGIAQLNQQGARITRGQAPQGGLIAGPLGAQIGLANDYAKALSTVNQGVLTQSDRMLQLIAIFGSAAAAQGAVSAAGLKLGTVLTETNTQFQRDLQTVAAYNTALVEMAGYAGGQALAAQNALNLSTNDQTLAIQKVVQAEGAYVTTLLAGETAFNTFATDLGTIRTQAGVAGASIGGLNKQSLALAGSYYGQLLPAIQAQIAALQNQMAGMNVLTPVIATAARHALVFAGNNDAARASLVGMINNALGPGTVSLQTLDGWLAKNAVGMRAYRKLVDAATVATSAWASQIGNLANQQFSNAILKASGLQGTIAQLSRQLVSGQTSAAALQPTFNALVNEFISAGLSSDQARNKASAMINEYGKVPKSVLTKLNADNAAALAKIKQTQGAINGLTGKTVPITVAFNVTGSGAQFLTGTGFRLASGGMITGGIPGRDSVLGVLMPGEVVVPTSMVQAGAVDHLRGRLPGFAEGGEVSKYNWYDRGGTMKQSPLIALTVPPSTPFPAPASRHSTDDVVKRLDTLIAVLKVAPRRTAQGINNAVNGVGRGATYKALLGAN